MAATDGACNYGGIGTVIGHEMTHGFDDQGSKFEALQHLVRLQPGGQRRGGAVSACS